MGHAALDLLGRERRAEFKDLDVLRFHERLERGEVHRASAGCAMVARGRLHVVKVEAGQPVRERFQMHRVLDETQVFLDLRVARVVPVAKAGAGQIPKQKRIIALERQLFEGLAVFRA